ncbi:3-hydroxybutyrate dehydrogenase [Parvularcula sp. ZS-1/3]|uniref:3-hydroxybutyrate dehydrogenase n=1 Tax=Parvularcula mediterranea TaxID=2732508 RepID=A0A7Y3RQN6_9PROT|nr:3-hydroxybutyrate dehydrogenase [Parvularcula mediterranea]NNU17607.1 3-hydroxybutyrate dehydrogenase [Parvularcula mediterranea]
MFDDLKGRKAVITGSTSGIGLAFAEALAKMGVDITLNGFGDKDEIEENRARIAGEYGVDVRYDGADMTKPEEIRSLISSAEAAHGRIDILVNNAGIQKVGPIDEYDDATWDRIIAICLNSNYHTIKAALPGMKSRGFGRIVNVASAHGLVASPFKSAYVAAKHGVVGLTKTVALEAGEDGVTCNAICPGFVKTPLLEAQMADNAKARGMTEEEVKAKLLSDAHATKEFVTYENLTALLCYLCSNAGSGSTGYPYAVDAGWTAH